jgi:hypothetical protein
MGLRQGIFTSAIGSLQSAFGDITNLDEGALSELAKVLQGDVIEAINQGLGKSDPQKLLGLILDTYYKRGEQGINSIGQNVGRYQAERELSTALEKAGLTDIADILRNMYYTNDTGIYQGRVDSNNAFQSYMNLITSYTNGLTAVDYGHASELGQVIDDLKKKFNELKENLETGLLKALGRVITQLWNWRIGQSAEESLQTDANNRELNQQALAYVTQRQSLAKVSLESMLKKRGINILSLSPTVTDIDSFKEYLAKLGNSSELLDPNNTDVQRLLQFLQTPEAEDFYASFLEYETASSLKKQAETNLASTGDIPYQPADFTPKGFQTRAGDILKQNKLAPMANSVLRHLMTQANPAWYLPIGSNTNELDFQFLSAPQSVANRDMLDLANVQEYAELQRDKVFASDANKNKYFKLWDSILQLAGRHSPNSSAYSRSRYYNERTGAYNKNKMAEMIQQLANERKRDGSLMFTQDMIYEALLPNLTGKDITGWGLTTQHKQKLTQAQQAIIARTYSQDYIGAKEVASRYAEQWNARFAGMSEGELARSVATARVYGYNANEKTINVTFTLKDAQGRVYDTFTYRGVNTDSAFSNGIDKTVDISGITRENLRNNNVAGN